MGKVPGGLWGEETGTWIDVSLRQKGSNTHWLGIPASSRRLCLPLPKEMGGTLPK